MNYRPSPEDLPQDLLIAIDLASVYKKYGLDVKASEELNKLVAGPPKAAASFFLANLYRYVGLNSLAKERYEEAIELAVTEEDFAVQIVAKAGLAQIETVHENKEEANRLLEEAKVGFDNLAEVNKESELGKWLEGLINGDLQLFLKYVQGCGSCTVDGTIGRCIGWDCWWCIMCGFN